jgi:hypothetical protein
MRCTRESGGVSMVMLLALVIGLVPIGVLAQTRTATTLQTATVTQVNLPGATVVGTKLTASSGYVLQRVPNAPNQIAIRRADGTGGSSATCKCTQGTGSCGLTISGDVAICSKSASNPCGDKCEWSTAATGGTLQR